MSVDIAKSGSFDGLAGSDVSLSARSALRIAMRRAAVPQLARAEAAATPFYDHLMSMIDATALENRRVPQNDAADASGFMTENRWRIHPLIPCIAGLMVVAAVGRITLSSDEAGPAQAPAVAAGAESMPADNSAAAMIANGMATPAAKPMPPTQPQEPEQRVAEARPAAGNTSGTSTPAVADARTGEASPAFSAGKPPSESANAVVGAAEASPSDKGTDQAADKGGDERTSPGPLRTGSIVPAAQPADAPAPSSGTQPIPASTDETGPAAGAGNESAALRTARILSGVRLRAGPGNGHAVLATIAGGTSVEVVDDCRAWCEVIFAGQRGFVYKGFLDR